MALLAGAAGTLHFRGKVEKPDGRIVYVEGFDQEVTDGRSRGNIRPSDAVTHWHTDRAGWMVWFPESNLQGTPSVQQVEPERWYKANGSSYRFVEDKSDLSQVAKDTLGGGSEQEAEREADGLRGRWKRLDRGSKVSVLVFLFSVFLWWVA